MPTRHAQGRVVLKRPRSYCGRLKVYICQPNGAGAVSNPPTLQPSETHCTIERASSCSGHETLRGSQPLKELRHNAGTGGVG